MIAYFLIWTTVSLSFIEVGALHKEESFSSRPYDLDPWHTTPQDVGGTDVTGKFLSQIQLLSLPEDDHGPIQELIFSPDGSSLLVSRESLLYLYETLTGDLLFRFSFDKNQRNSRWYKSKIKFSQDSAVFAVKDDQQIYLYEIASKKEIQFQNDKDNWIILSYRFSPDGSFLVTWSENRDGNSYGTHFYDTKSGEEITHLSRIFPSQRYQYLNSNYVAFSSDSSLATIWHDQTIYLYDLEEKKEMRHFDAPFRRDFFGGTAHFFSLDKSTLVVANRGELFSYDVHTGQKLYQLKFYAGNPSDLSISSDKSLMAFRNYREGESVLSVREIKSGRSIYEIPFPHVIYDDYDSDPSEHTGSFLFSPRGSFLVTATHNDNPKLRTYDARSGRRLYSLSIPISPLNRRTNRKYDLTISSDESVISLDVHREAHYFHKTSNGQLLYYVGMTYLGRAISGGSNLNRHLTFSLNKSMLINLGSERGVGAINFFWPRNGRHIFRFNYRVPGRQNLETLYPRLAYSFSSDDSLLAVTEDLTENLVYLYRVDPSLLPH